ncbi:MAG: 5'-3' exonuclease H3TH domain-containing protein [Candidatus Paceibacterota bacterium]
MKHLLLIDSHALIHRMYHAMAPLTGPNNEPVGAIYGLAKIFLKIRKEVRPEYIAACFDRPEPTFRAEQYSEYKATRTKADDDLIWQIENISTLFDLFKIKSFEAAGFEADDLIGTLAKRYQDEKGLQTVIFSGDKDLLQLVKDNDVVVDLIRPRGEVKQYNQALVEEEFGIKPEQIIDLKGLTGDTSDNIPGVQGIGPKSAAPLIKEWGSVEEIFENLVIINPKIAKKLEGQKDIALLSKKLATIETNAPIYTDSLEDLKTVPLNIEEIKNYFNHLGFVSLISELDALALTN